MQIGEFTTYLTSLPGYQGQIAHIRRIAPREAQYQDLGQALPPALQEALARRGVARFYTHQAEAIDAARAGRHVMVATGTASGKTLCYNVPVLEAILQDPLARALYLFPTKALAQDQLRALQELTGHALKMARALAFANRPPSSSPIRICCTWASCRIIPCGPLFCAI